MNIACKHLVMLSRHAPDFDCLDMQASLWLQPDGILKNVSAGHSIKSMGPFLGGTGDCEKE